MRARREARARRRGWWAAQREEGRTYERQHEKRIPREMALQLCAAIQAENRRKWYTAAGMMRLGCVEFSKGDPARQCFASRPDNRGCYQVNARQDARLDQRLVAR